MFVFKQSTATQIRLLGPFVDPTDGSVETGLTVNAADIRISKAGANIVAKNSGGGTHDELGLYAATFDATDTNTVGQIQIMVDHASALPVYHEGWVFEEAIFDALYGAAAGGFDASGRVDIGSWLGTAVTLGAGAPDVNIQSTDDIDLSATQKVSVNTEVLDVNNVDTIPEMTGVPPAIPTQRQAAMFLFMALRNLVNVDSNSNFKEFTNDAGTVIWKKAISDAANIYSEAEGQAGP